MDPEAAERAQEIRRRHRLRRAILTGRVRLPPEAAARLIGPDCAFHLYGWQRPGHEPTEPTSRTAGRDVARG